jgi:hypothetical protein
MAPKLRPNPKYQTLVAKAAPSHTANRLVLPSFVSSDRIAESNRLIADFDDIYNKLLGVKNDILAETDSKTLRELYGSLGNLLVSFHDLTFAEFVDMSFRGSQRMSFVGWRHCRVMDGISHHTSSLVIGLLNWKGSIGRLS